MNRSTSLLIVAATLLLVSCCDCDSKNPATSNSKPSLLDVGFESDEKSEKATETKTETESEKKAAPPKPLKSNSQRHYGMDISHFQGDLIEKLSTTDSISFVICKATQGDYFIDPDFHTNWTDIKETGRIRGTYHFYMCADNPITQADHFVSVVEKIEDTDIAPVLDIEQGSMTPNVSSDQMEKDILVFLKAVEQKLSRKPILYTDYAFAQEYLTNPVFATYDLWLADYTTAKTPLIPDTWKTKGYKIWQKSASYHTESETADLDFYKGSLTNLVR